ncbi:GMC family oxidoreductase [Halobacteriales archaeon SW_12_67_38]|nr:MAG: GMC family oxidoreductase [Halobacteriales archaeon SW_12_67_38]
MSGADRTPADSADVCVIGAGPAGALCAHRLIERGHDVVILEAGPRFSFEDRPERMERSIRSGDDRSVWDMGGERDAYTSTGPRSYPLNRSRVKGVGGTSLHWQGMVMRLHEADFERRSRDGVAADWPIEYDDLRPYYAAAERAFGVAGAADNPFAPPREEPYPLRAFPPSYSDSIFAEACEQLEITTHSVPNARNSEPYDGRSACVGYGTCKPVCASGAKYDATVHIEKAEAAGARVIDRAPVQRLETDGKGRVARAVYATPGGEHSQEARRFVLACGGVETPRLLLLSDSPEHPNGLANSSGLVGRYFTEHCFAGVGGRLDRRTRQKHVGFNTTESHQFYDEEGVNPIKLELLNYAGPSPVEQALAGDEWGDALLDSLRDVYGTHVAVGGLVEQLPRKENRVMLDRSTTDDHGNPVPEVRWSIDERTRESIRRANEIQRAILEELGAAIEWTIGPGNTGPAFHHMGTTRMGTDPESSVVNPELRAHDVENLHIASSALKAADHVDRAL